MAAKSEKLRDYGDGEFRAFYREKDPKRAVESAVALHVSNKDQATTRRMLAAKYGSLYENVSLSSLAPYGYAADATHYFTANNGREQIPLIRNTANAIIDAQVNWIAALDDPKPTFLTTQGNWVDKRKADKLRKLVLAGYDDRQGCHPNTYQLGHHALRMASAATGVVAVKVIAYPNEPKVSHELRDTLDMAFDWGELTYGELLTLVERTWFDADRLAEIYPDFEEEIFKNLEEVPKEFNFLAGQSKVKRMVALYEGWRSQTSERPGKYVAGLKDGTPIAFDDYEYDSPPFAWLVCNPNLWGPLGSSTTHLIYESVLRDNLILSRIDRAVSKACQSVTFANQEALSDPTSLEWGEDAQVIYLRNMAQAPQYHSPAGFSRDQLELAREHKNDAHDVSGMSEARTGGKAATGIDSAVGQRNVSALTTKRFASLQTRYIQFLGVDIAKLDIRAWKEIHERDPKFKKNYPGKDFLLEIDGSVLDLEDSRYVLSSGATSGIKNTPADRSQTALELLQAGVLSNVSAAMAQQDFDTPGALDDATPQRRWLSKEMYKWAYATDEETQDPDFYRGPLKYWNLPDALIQVIDGLTEAQLDDLEDERLEFFMLFLSDLDAQIQAKAAFAASLGAPPGAPPAMPPGAPGAGPPGLPAGGPPPPQLAA